MDASLSLPPQVNITRVWQTVLQLILFYKTISIFVWRYFTTISGYVTLIDGSDKATIILPGGTILHLHDALYSTQSKRNLLSFKDIRWTGYHLETMNDDTCEFLLITATHDDKKKYSEKLTIIRMWFISNHH